MKTLAITIIVLISANVFGQENMQNSQPVEVMSAQEVRGAESETQLEKREELQYQNDPNIQAQLQQAKENVKVDEKNIEKAKSRKKDSEAQVDIDEASIEKYEAQLQEDKAQVKKLEEQIGGNEKKKDKKGFFQRN